MNMQDRSPQRDVFDIWAWLLRLARRDVLDQSFPALGRFHYEIARAELSDAIPEFYALGIQAIMHMAERSDDGVVFCLEMADAVACSQLEQCVARHWWELHRKPEANESSNDSELQSWSDRTDNDMLLALADQVLEDLRRLGILRLPREDD